MSKFLGLGRISIPRKVLSVLMHEWLHKRPDWMMTHCCRAIRALLRVEAWQRQRI